MNSLKCISNAIGLTIGKEYEILKEGKYWFKVKNDNNELVHYSKDNFENGKQYNRKISHLFFYDGKL